MTAATTATGTAATTTAATTTAATATTAGRTAARTRTGTPWTVMGAAVLATAFFVVTSTSPRATQLGVLVLVAVTGAAVALSRDARRRGVAAAAGLLTLLLAVPVNRITDGGPLLLLVLAGAAAVGGAGVVAASGRALPRGTWALGLLFAALAAATALGGETGGLVALALVAVACVPVFLVVGTLDEVGRRQVALVLLALAVVQALLAVVEPWVYPAHLWAPAQLGSQGQVVALSNEVLGSLERSQGTLGHPLPLGMLLVVALAVTTRYLGDARPRTRHLLQGVLLLGIVFAGARSSLVMAVVVLVLLSGRLTPARTLGAMLAGTVGAAVLVATSWDTSGRVGQIAESGSWQHRVGALQSLDRLLLWQDTAAVVLGNGYGSTARVMSAGLLQNDGFAAVDNQFVLLLSQGGLLALGALCTLLALGLLRGSPQALPALLCVAATLMVFDVLLWPGASVVLGTVLGLALGAPVPPAAAGTASGPHPAPPAGGAS